MEEILHQLRLVVLSHDLQSFTHPRWLARCLPSTVASQNWEDDIPSGKAVGAMLSFMECIQASLGDDTNDTPKTLQSHENPALLSILRVV